MRNQEKILRSDKEEPKHKGKLQALDSLSLGVSIVVAILFGVGIGYLLKDWSGYVWTLWLGVFWGVASAFLNIYKAYQRAKKDLDELADDPRYKHRAEFGDNLDND